MSYKIIHGDKFLESLAKLLSSFRTNNVSSSILETIKVVAYGEPTAITHLASITVPEPRQLLITPYDKSLLTAIDKAITESNLGVTPNNNGAGIRLSFPALTEDRKKEISKSINKEVEILKGNVRENRVEMLKKERRRKEDGELSEDELKRFENDLQKEIDQLMKEMDERVDAKVAEVMKV